MVSLLKNTLITPLLHTLTLTAIWVERGFGRWTNPKEREAKETHSEIEENSRDISETRRQTDYF